MKKIRVNLVKNAYDIIIGNNTLSLLPKLISHLTTARNAIIIINPTLKEIYAKKLNQIFKSSSFGIKYLVVPDSETTKSLKYFTSTITKVAKLSGNKPVFIIAFGGGVIGDLAGFVASVYKRGIPYVQVPTTLLAQVDSAIGGKTAIDLGLGKNLVGAFYQPALVLTDISLLQTLDKRQIKSGLAEIIKYAAIMDAKLFAYLEKHYIQVLNLKKSVLEKVIYFCSRHKAGIVAKDEKETKGIRTILNFGHTVGHAIEAAGKYAKFNHGEAVAIGMAAAANISVRLGLLQKKDFSRLVNLLNLAGLPTRFKGIGVLKILKALARDKKFIHGYNRLVLIKGIGKAIVKEKIEPKIIEEAISTLVSTPIPNLETAV